MSQLREKILEIENKKRRYTIKYLIAGLLVFGAFSFFYISSLLTQIKAQETLTSKTSQLRYLGQGKKLGELKDEKSAKQLLELEEALEFLSATTTDVLTKKGIDSILKRVAIIYQVNSDTVTIRYYKRTADNNTITKAFQSIEGSMFHLDEIKTTNDSSNLKVNTITYGRLVDREYLNLISKTFEKQNIDIIDFRPLKSKSYKDAGVIKIFYEAPFVPQEDSNTINSGNDFDIRIYSYQPDIEIKKGIQEILEEDNYHVSVFPDWKTRPSFFSTEPTILYYSNQTKEKAIQLANALSNQLNNTIKFKISKGYGYGVLEEEKKRLFIIHYLGNKATN
ncbi:MAG: hypothetical protein JKY02_07395 [Flavobacteriaceae bacterium]|nr:hypothetical protein [Flavobacteriaceae bacterium]